MIPELTIRYNYDLRPSSAQCSSCSQLMPAPPHHLQDAATILMWFSARFLEHRKQKHPMPPYGTPANPEAPRDDLS